MICSRCLPVLSRYVDSFRELTHRGSHLKRVKHINPSPLSPDGDHYRDVKRQNEWIRENIFDVMGNYLFCASCVCSAFRISYQRLTRQRNVKRQFSTAPLVDMKKNDVEQQRLGQYVVMPKDLDLPFIKWWRSLDHSCTVQVRYPYEQHGNSGKELHSSKQNIRKDYLEFVEANIQPNGRSADSSGPTHYFMSTMQSPKKYVANYEDRLRRSVVDQQENDKGGCRGVSRGVLKHPPQTCSNYSWLYHYCS